jgi:CrcB protein
MGNEVLPAHDAQTAFTRVKPMTSVNGLQKHRLFANKSGGKNMLEFIVVGAGGFLGSCLRYGITKLMEHWAVSLPFGTLLSNVLAGFFIGFIIGLEQQAAAIPARAKLFLTTGLLGGLSTFSAFSLETVSLFQSKEYLLAGGNILLNLGLSLAGVLLGMALATLLVRPWQMR